MAEPSFSSPDRTRTVFIEEVLQSACVLDEEGAEKEVSKDFFQFGYDYSILHTRNELLVTEVTFTLTQSDEATIGKQIAENLAWRNENSHRLSSIHHADLCLRK